MKELRIELNDAASNYQASVPHLRKYLLLVITVPLNILTRNLKDRQYHIYTELNINSDLKDEAALKPHRFRMDKNNIPDTIPSQTSSGYHTTISSSDVRIRDKMNMNKTMFLPTCVCFTINKDNQDKMPYLSAVPTV